MPKPLLGPNGAPISPADVDAARQRARADTGDVFEIGHDERGFRMANEGAERNGTFTRRWRPVLRSADADYLPERDIIQARQRDLGRNSGIAVSARNRRLNTAVGFRWRLSPRINPRALGISAAAAQELRQQIKARFHPYAYGPSFQADAERCKTFGQLLRMAAAQIFDEGEALGVVEYAGDEETPFRTRLRMIDPDRLSQPYGEPQTLEFRGGIQKVNGVPVTYFIREAHPNDLLGIASPKVFKWKPWARYATPLGRPQVLHAFDALRPQQTRGVTRFAASLTDFRALTRFSKFTLERQALNAMHLGIVKSQGGPGALSENVSADDLISFEEQADDWYRDHPLEMEGVEIKRLRYGDEFQLATATPDVSQFDAFFRAHLRLIAAALGVTYEELSMDFSQTNYSSARAAFLVAWKEVLAMRGLIKAQIADPFYLAWLEEAIDLGADNGGIDLPKGAPDFYEAMDAYAECHWIGPAQGYVDPVKEILAAAARIEGGFSSMERECADQDEDVEDVLDAEAWYVEQRQQRGLPPLGPSLAQAMQDTRNPSRPAPGMGDEVTTNEEDAPDQAGGGQTGKKTARAKLEAVAASEEHARALGEIA